MPIFDSPNAKRYHPMCFWELASTSSAVRGLEPYIEPSLQAGTTPLVKKSVSKFTRDFRSVRILETDERFFKGDRAIREGKYKLVVRDGEKQELTQLFNLRADPSEKSDITSKYPENVFRLQGLLRDWQTSVLSSLANKDY